MPSERRWPQLKLLGAALLLAGCGALLGLEDSEVHGVCSSGAECAPGFDCLQGLCRDRCANDGECSAGARCLKAIGTSACVPADESCGAGCPEGTTCSVGVCRTDCARVDDCAGGQECRGGLCVGTDMAHDPGLEGPASGGSAATGGSASDAGESATGGRSGAGGVGTGGVGTGGVGTGDAGTGGSTSAAGESHLGGAGSGAGGSASTAGSSVGGVGTAGAGGAGGGAGAQAGGGTGGTGPTKNDPIPSVGCGDDTTVTTGKKTITSSGDERSYIIDIPADYNKDRPYRLFYMSHWLNGSPEAVRDENFYSLKPLAEAANQPAIFVAPQAAGTTWLQKDHALFDDILAHVKANLCIDTTRVFATGFSMGAMITYSLSVNHQKVIRAAVGIAPANYNIYLPAKTHEPIAWMQTTGMSDGTCPWVGSGSMQGAKFIAIERGTDNGCAVPDPIPIWQSGGHVCYDMLGCDAGYPTKVCTFNGGHVSNAKDAGSNTNWIAQQSWEFFSQF